MKKSIQRIVRTVIAATLSLAIMGAGSSAFAAESAFSQWKTDDWTEATENGTPILKSQPGKSINVLYLKGKATGNKLSFDIRVDNSFGTVDGNVGSAFKLSDGTQYFFEYNTVGELVRIRRLGNDGSDSHVCPGKSYKLTAEQWHTVSLEFAENHLLWQIDGETVHELSETGNDKFEGGTLYIQSYNTDVSLRNISVESVYIPIVEKREYDFEFTSEKSVADFSARNGGVTWKNGRLIYTLTGNDSTLTSPPISVKQGTAYSALLPLRNTVLIRMSNGTDASRIRLSYTTTDDPAYTADKSVVLDVQPRSGDTTYYFNLSACRNLSGYLYGFRLEPIGAASGSIEIEAVTFEREAALTGNVGKLTSCTTDGKTVTVCGTLDSAYAGREVTLYETRPENYRLDLREQDKLTSCAADGTAFTLTVPYENAGMTRLSSLFLLGVAGEDGKPVRIGERFWIRNGDSYDGGNPYAFTLPDYTVSVLDFGARGDGFTNDTPAIQQAIDHVSAKGGGVVVVPGDDSFYGRRYVATNIRLKDNVELRIETGAVIWQSPRPADYAYDVVYGHDVSIPGVNWTHAASCHNMPLIHGDQVSNVRVTGGGVIRMQDAGGENLDSVSAGSLWTGCPYKIHLIPLGFFRCENVEISDVHLRRTNNYHINLRTCRNIYVSGVSMWEVTCASGDGISATVGTKNITINRCFFYSNDDAVTICSTYNDPRGIAWWHANPDGDNCVDNLVVRHSYLVGGHGITFIPWGTDNPRLDMQEIRNVEVYDSCLGGGSSAVGAWPDNPYFGKQPFDNTETDDFSPVKGVRIHNNRYFGACTLECIQGTDIITDCGIRSASQFRYGDFERNVRRYKNFTSGLSNWSFQPVEGKPGGADVKTDGNNHFGVVYGDGTLCQGLWMSKGEHTFTADVRLLAGSGALTVRDAVSGEILAEKALETGDSFAKVSLTFTLTSGRTAYLGVTHTGSAEQAVYIDNASVTNPEFVRMKYFTETFDDAETLQLINKGFSVTDEAGNSGNQIAEVGGGRTGIMMLTTEKEYQEFDLHYRMRFDCASAEIDANIGVSLRRTDSGNQYDIHYNPLCHFLMIREYKGGAESILQRVDNFDLEPGKWVDVAIRVQDNTCILYMDGKPVTEFSVAGLRTGVISLRAYNVNCAYDDVVVAPVGTTYVTGKEELSTETDTESAQPDTETGTGDATGTSAPVTATAPASDANTTAAASASGKGCNSALGGAGLLAVAATAATAVGCARGKKKNGERV